MRGNALAAITSRAAECGQAAAAAANASTWAREFEVGGPALSGTFAGGFGELCRNVPRLAELEAEIGRGEHVLVSLAIGELLGALADYADAKPSANGGRNPPRKPPGLDGGGGLCARWAGWLASARTATPDAISEISRVAAEHAVEAPSADDQDGGAACAKVMNALRFAVNKTTTASERLERCAPASLSPA